VRRPIIEVDLSSLDLRRLIIIGGGVLAIVIAAVGLLLLTRNPEQESLALSTLSASPTSSPSPTASLATGPAVEMASPAAEAASPAPTSTLEPYCHTVQPGDTVTSILLLYGYTTLDVIPEVLALNGLSSPEMIAAGQTLCIPRQTPTPGPPPSPTIEGATPKPTERPVILGATSPPSDAEAGSPENRVLSADGLFWVHAVREGESLALIATEYDSNLNCIIQNNTFTHDAEGNPLVYQGQRVNVCVIVTPIPSPTPTGGPGSTATPTPTYSPPLLLAPANGASIARNQDVVLQWAAIRPLGRDERYLVIVQDLARNQEFRATTRTNSLRLPSELRPGAGKSGEYEWRVVIVGEDDIEAPAISGLGEPYRFVWE
jgi:LysM repeat protein